MDVNELLITSSRAKEKSMITKVKERLSAQGLFLSSEEAELLLDARSEALLATGRVEFGEPCLVTLSGLVASSPALCQDNLVRDLSELQSSFYALRDELPLDVPDDEIFEALSGCLDECGDVELLSALDADAIMRFSDEYCRSFESGDVSGYRIVDDEGRAYSFKEEEWEYDECSDGWNGERWSDDFDN